MRATTIMAAAAFTVGTWSAAALADETAAGAKQTGPGQWELETQIIHGKRMLPNAAIDVSRLVPRAPLPDLRQSFVDRSAKAVEKDPF